jgi:hypothetical protein
MKEINGILSWLENNQEAGVFDAKQKEPEGNIMPMMQAAYQAAAGCAGAGVEAAFQVGLTRRCSVAVVVLRVLHDAAVAGVEDLASKMSTN